jgi:hypothetical protein
MMKTALALGVGIFAPSFLAMAVLGCSGSDSIPSTGALTGAGGSHQSTTTGGSTGGTGGGFTGTTSGTGGTGTSLGGAAGSGPTSCTPPMFTTAMPTSDVLTNLDMDSAVSGFSPGGGWFSYKDDEPTGMLSPSNTAFMTESPGANNSAAAVHVVGSGFMPDQVGQNYGGGVGFSLASPQGTPGDLSGYAGITFYAKSGKASDLSDIKVAFSTTATDPLFCICNAAGCFNSHFKILSKVSASWTLYTVKWSELGQADWGYKAPFDPKTVLTINFVSNGALPAFDFWVDEVSLVH